MTDTDPVPGGPSEAVTSERLERTARIVLRPIGSPLPLGFAALGAASVVLSGLQLGWVPMTDSHQVALVVIVFAVPLQLLASIFGFLARDSVGGTGMGLLGGTWLATGTLLLTSTPGSTSRTLGLFLFFVAVGLMVPTTAAALGKVAAAVVMFGAGARFALTGMYEFVGGSGWERASAWWGIGLCVVALYATMAFELEDTRRATVLPVFRHGVGKRALDGTVLDQVARIQNEAGVREQL